MKITYLNHITQFHESALIMALGFFDGFHLGHESVLKEALSLRKTPEDKAVILTFDRSIHSFLKGEKDTYLTSIDDKISLAESLGFDEIIFIEVTRELVDLPYTDFYHIFLEPQKALVLGFDYSFGKDGLGNAEYLQSNFKRTVKVVSKLSTLGHKIGTYEIKTLLAEGNIEEAENELGRTYQIRGYLYKRNKNFAFSSGDYFLPRNGNYQLVLSTLTKSYKFLGKIKALKDGNGLLIKTEDEAFLNNNISRDELSSLSFMVSSSIIL